MDARGTLRVGDESFEIFRLDALQEQWDVARLPFTLRVLLENVLRNGGETDADCGGEACEACAMLPPRVASSTRLSLACLAIVDPAAMRGRHARG